MNGLRKTQLVFVPPRAQFVVIVLELRHHTLERRVRPSE